MIDTLNLLFQVSILVFVITTMLSMGLGLKVKQIIEPLKNINLIIVVIITNFFIIPLITLGITIFLPIDEGSRIALILLSLAAGAPFIPKLAEIAKGDTALATAIMLLLMVATVIILPIALPIFIGGDITVNSFAIAKSLVIMMIFPLIIALYIKAKKETLAIKWQPRMVKLSNLSLLGIIIIMSILHGKSIIDIFGYDLVAVILFMISSIIIGYIMGGVIYTKKVISSLSAGQRNISAALVVSAQNFADNPKVTIVIITVSVIGLFILLFSAKKFRKVV